MTVATPSIEVEGLITTRQAADLIGVPLRTFYDWRKHRRGPKGYRIGGRVQFRPSEVAAWIEQHREE